jgi:hypothetical protein
MGQEIYGWLVDHLGANTAGVLAVVFFVTFYVGYLRMKIRPLKEIRSGSTTKIHSQAVKVPIELQTPISYLERREK